MNFCPTCNNELTFCCTNESESKHCRCDPTLQSNIINIDGNRSRCPYCGFEVEWDFWAAQEIEIFIAIQGVNRLTEAGELHDERRREWFIRENTGIDDPTLDQISDFLLAKNRELYERLAARAQPDAADGG